MGSDDPADVIHRAERIIWVTGWRLQEEWALRQLAGTCGLACARLDPHSEVIQLVTYDGEHVGHIRRESQRGQEEAWIAVTKDQRRLADRYRTALAAAEGLARACGIQLPRQA